MTVCNATAGNLSSLLPGRLQLGGGEGRTGPACGNGAAGSDRGRATVGAGAGAGLSLGDRLRFLALPQVFHPQMAPRPQAWHNGMGWDGGSLEMNPYSWNGSAGVKAGAGLSPLPARPLSATAAFAEGVKKNYKFFKKLKGSSYKI